MPARKPRQPRLPGRLARQIVVSADFDETPEDIAAAFEGDLGAWCDAQTEP